MTARKHWAILVGPRAGSGGGVAIAEVEMRAAVGGADQCTGGTPGGVTTSGNPASNAFDNSTSTLWHHGSAFGGQRLSYEFAAPVEIVEMAITLPGAGSAYPGTTFGPAAVWVQWSDDGVTWNFGRGTTSLEEFTSAQTAVIAVSDAPPPATVTGLVRRVTGYVGPQGQAAFLASGLYALRPLDDGPYRIAGTVANDGTPVVPVRRRVRLFDQATGRLVRQVWSQEDTGAFEFSGLALRPYLVVTDDHTRLYDPVARSEVVPA